MAAEEIEQAMEVEMRYRRFGRAGWSVSEIGYGMWGMGSWSGSSDEESLASLQHAVDLGCNFFDTAWAYGEGRSEALLGELVRNNPEQRIYTASKIPPKNRQWPSRRQSTLDDCFPPDHIEQYVHSSLANAKSGKFRPDAISRVGRFLARGRPVGKND